VSKSTLAKESRVQSSLLAVDAAIRSGGFPSGGTPAGTLAVPAAGLQVQGSRSVTVAGAAPETGQETVFFRPVLTAPAFVKRDRRVLADAWLPDLVRLGVLEAHLGDGVIEKIVEKGLRNGSLPLRERRRLLSYPLVIRLVIAMTLMPRASYSEAARALVGLLVAVPFTRDWHVPAGKSIGEWRMLIPRGSPPRSSGAPPAPSSAMTSRRRSWWPGCPQMPPTGCW
jgi:hypothetical protein